MIDDAIVMLENISATSRRDTPLEAALKGSGEIGFTILSISVSLVAVFIPLLLMGGIVGRLFREFAVTVTDGRARLRCRLADADADDGRALPAPASRAAREPDAAAADGALERFFRGSNARTSAAALVAPPHQRATLLLALRYPRPHRAGVREDAQGLLSRSRTPVFSTATAEGAPTSRSPRCRRGVQVGGRSSGRSRGAASQYTIGAGRARLSLNNCRYFITLKERGERDPAAQVIDRLRQQTASVPGLCQA